MNEDKMSASWQAYVPGKISGLVFECRCQGVSQMSWDHALIHLTKHPAHKLKNRDSVGRLVNLAFAAGKAYASNV